MQEDGELQIKGWPAALLAVVIVLGGGGYLLVLPGQLHHRERKAIIEHIQDERNVELAAAVEMLKKNPHDKQNPDNAVAVGEEYLKKIKIVSATVPPRGLSSGKKVKITYTVGGKKPKTAPAPCASCPP